MNIKGFSKGKNIYLSNKNRIINDFVESAQGANITAHLGKIKANPRVKVEDHYRLNIIGQIMVLKLPHKWASV